MLATLRGRGDVQFGECNMAAATADFAHARTHTWACFVVTESLAHALALPSIYITSAINWGGGGG